MCPSICVQQERTTPGLPLPATIKGFAPLPDGPVTMTTISSIEAANAEVTSEGTRQQKIAESSVDAASIELEQKRLAPNSKPVADGHGQGHNGGGLIAGSDVDGAEPALTSHELMRQRARQRYACNIDPVKREVRNKRKRECMAASRRGANLDSHAADLVSP